MPLSRDRDEQRIRAALGGRAQPTEYYAREAGCSLGRAAEVLNRLFFAGVAEHPTATGFDDRSKWRAVRCPE
jgi:hypothetical protein